MFKDNGYLILMLTITTILVLSMFIVAHKAFINDHVETKTIERVNQQKEAAMFE